MQEAQIRSVALFFYYTFLDKSLALRASTEALADIEARAKKSVGTGINSILVFSTNKIWKKYSKKRNVKTQDFDQVPEGWIVPSDLKMETWRHFVKEGDPQQYLTVIWSILLGISDTDISEGLGASEGSVRYRVGLGLKHLGEVSKPHQIGASLNA